ncbi:hydrolase [Kurthia gibsonii]|uniref:hydrolase n=1 Tax=Kurthia gibsonii TaxID=33946 RepID=UPI001143C90E|nr:hydrolase [Kurthia gibsonii]GED19033.1 hydrolase [Kurthia gibsonii]
MNLEQTAVVLIDVQGRLATLMNRHEETLRKLEQLLKGAKTLELPIVWLEQYPRGLGPTVDSLAEILSPITKPIEKITFSAWGTDEFKEALIASGKKQILLCGIETHICVYQTAKDLKAAGFHVEVAADAVDSRCELDREIALRRFEQENIPLTTVEMALFELLKVAKGDAFKQISKIIK